MKVKEIFEKHDITKKDYIYGRPSDDGTWRKTKGTSKRFDKPLIKKIWFDNKYSDEEDLEVIKDETEDAPPILKLKTAEKFYGNDGEIIEIEVRGERHHDKCFFKVTDVSTGFDVLRLHNVIIGAHSTYEEYVDYKYFYCISCIKDVNKKIRKMFLTYDGILKVLYTSRGKNGGKFRAWASKTLNVAQMGTVAQKSKLACKLLGVDTQSLINVLKTVPTPISCIYFFLIGTVKDLRNKYNIPKSITGD